jgi:hypothetical protein
MVHLECPSTGKPILDFFRNLLTRVDGMGALAYNEICPRARNAARSRQNIL